MTMLLLAAFLVIAALVIVAVNSPFYRTFAALIDSWADEVHGNDGHELR